MNCPTCREQMANAATADARAHLAGCPHCAAWWAEHLAKRALAPAAVRRAFAQGRRMHRQDAEQAESETNPYPHRVLWRKRFLSTADDSGTT